MRFAVVLLGLIIAAVESRAGLELSALMQVNGEPRFVVTDLDDGARSDWLKLGQTFHGYELSRYDARSDALLVRRGGLAQEIGLKGSRVQPAPAPTIATEFAARGITPEDLVVTDAGPVRITLVPAAREQPSRSRWVDVVFDNGQGRSAITFGREGPRTLSRSFTPEAARETITDAELAAINAHLATVLAKWLPDAPGG